MNLDIDKMKLDDLKEIVKMLVRSANQSDRLIARLQDRVLKLEEIAWRDEK